MKYKDLFGIHQKYVHYLVEKSYLLNQSLKNISESGGVIEEAIREIIKSVISPRFKVTHGYIVNAKNKTVEPQISPQCDLLIIDTMVAK